MTRLPDYRIAVEFRHKSWLEDRNVEETLSFLEEREPPAGLRRHAAGLRLLDATDRRRDRGRPGDGALPRARPEGVGDEERERERALPLRLRENELKEWVPKIEGLAGEPARRTS